MQKGILQAEVQLKKAKAEFKPGMILATLLLPAVHKVYEASYRTERKFAAHRCLEALRVYAAEHDGKLPAALKDITEVPVPNDPYSATPFQYELKGNTATLTAPPAAGQTPYIGNSFTYQITIQK
jgi:hypothetical protein